MQKLFNDLIHIKDLIIDQKSKYQTNMTKCCNIFSRRFDELNLFCLKITNYECFIQINTIGFKIIILNNN